MALPDVLWHQKNIGRGEETCFLTLHGIIKAVSLTTQIQPL